MDTVVDHMDAVGFDSKKILNLACRECGNSDDRIALLSGFSRLFSESRSKFRRRIVSRHYKQVMKGRYGASARNIHALI